jgi:hypothetical protein
MVKLDRARPHGAVHLVSASLAGALVFGAGACTLLYNPDNLGGPDGSAPGEPDAAPGTPDAQPLPRPDAAPGDLAIYELSPSVVDEGMGVERAVPVAILGANMEQSAMVRLTGPGQNGALQTLRVSENGALAVFELAVPVDSTLGEAANIPVTVEVVQGGQMESLQLTVNWLDELVITSSTSLDSDTLAVKYSRINIGANVQAAGDAPLRLVATAELVLGAVVDAAGKNGSPDDAGDPGPGGCIGGKEGESGACTPSGGGGAQADDEGGGGGGGHAAAGMPGTSRNPGLGGGVSGIAAMTDLAQERGNGGGGGGSGGSKGGGGGGGGGVIELRSLGILRLGGAARLLVEGGDGGGCSGGGGNGGGGGGSGGAILLRSAAPIDDSAAADFLVLGGGLGGTTMCSGTGGAGARGRARVDAPELPASAASAFPFHGAVLDPATPTIVGDPMLTVAVLGGGGRTFAVKSPLTGPQPVQLDVDGRGTGDVMLSPGVNRVCVLMTQTDLPSGDDENCLDVAYVP